MDGDYTKNIKFMNEKDNIYDLSKEEIFLKACNNGFLTNIKKIKQSSFSTKIETCKEFIHFGITNANISISSKDCSLLMSPVLLAIERDLEMSINISLLSNETNFINLNNIEILKTSFFLLRSAIENTMGYIYFTHRDKENIHVDIPETRQWLTGKIDTPFIKKFKNYIFDILNFKEFSSKTDFLSNLETLLKQINNIIHNKKRISYFSEKTFDYFLNSFIKTCENIAIMLILFKPVILLDLPVFEKFGFNPPIDFDDLKPEVFRKIISYNYFVILYNIAINDDYAIGIQEWMSSLPNLSKQEIKESADWMRKINKSS